MYRVEYDTLAIMNDGRIGNVRQNDKTKIAYTEAELGDIDKKLSAFLKEKKLYPIIKKVEKIDGHII